MSKSTEIIKLRRALDWTQAELADFCGVGQVAVSFWESGHRTPSGSAQKLLSQLAKKSSKKLCKLA